jgi:hypothetical protein
VEVSKTKTTSRAMRPCSKTSAGAGPRIRPQTANLALLRGVFLCFGQKTDQSAPQPILSGQIKEVLTPNRPFEQKINNLRIWSEVPWFLLIVGA